jgi:putative FmdB family regulatory protein
MPTYTYKCAECEEVFDIFQSFSAKPLKKHSECGGALQKVFHPAGIVFKGSGFYKTDSVSSNSSSSSDKTSSSSKTSSSTGSKASESDSVEAAPKPTKKSSSSADE